MTQPKISAEAWGLAIEAIKRQPNSEVTWAVLQRIESLAYQIDANTAAQPAAGNDAVRALVGKWRTSSNLSSFRLASDIFDRCANDLEAALSDNAGGPTGETK